MQLCSAYGMEKSLFHRRFFIRSTSIQDPLLKQMHPLMPYVFSPEEVLAFELWQEPLEDPSIVHEGNMDALLFRPIEQAERRLIVSWTNIEGGRRSAAVRLRPAPVDAPAALKMPPSRFFRPRFSHADDRRRPFAPAVVRCGRSCRLHPFGRPYKALSNASSKAPFPPFPTAAFSDGVPRRHPPSRRKSERARSPVLSASSEGADASADSEP